MKPEQLLEQAKNCQNKLVETRHYLHQHPETEFNLTETKKYIKSELAAMGYEPKDCGKCGVTVTVGGKKPGKVFLLRGDMDALPIKEESDVPFSSDNGNMHACGHDMHATMLLGAAKLLKDMEDDINGTVKLMFQPAEEVFEGAKDMIGAGVLENPKVDAALMIHVMAGMPFPAGTVIVCGGGVSAPGADFFKIKIQGKGCHGSMPNNGVDPINVAAHIITALQEIHSRELSLNDDAVLTIGSIHGGQAPNIIPDTVEMDGSIRTYDEEIRKYLKNRMTEISTQIAAAFRADAEVSFNRGCPVLLNNADLSKDVAKYTKELLGAGKALTQSELLSKSADSGKPVKSTGSEDFAYISQEVPSIMLSLAAGEPEKGYEFPQHHPKVKFDESVLSSGSAVYAYTAVRWLEEHK
ncbi:MAG: M20 family metallopeptidase [Acutalibacteraceae bacterium]